MTGSQKVYRLAYWIASFIIAAVLLSGYHKLLYPADFALAVYRFHLLPDAAVNLVAIYLPWLEISCAICLLFIPRYRVAALWISLILLVLFTGGISINLLHGNEFSCGCFGSNPMAKPMNWLNVARNMGLILIATLALIANRRAENVKSNPTL